jgi:hypothetical protein
MIGTLVIIAGCIVIMLVLAALVVGVVIMGSSNRDVVSTARQGWINRRSEQDQDGW